MKYIITPSFLTVVNDDGEELNVHIYPSEYAVLSHEGRTLLMIQAAKDPSSFTTLPHTKQDVKEAVFNLVSTARYVTRRNGIDMPLWLKP